MRLKSGFTRIFNKLTGKVTIIKTTIIQFLTIHSAPKITRHVNFGALRRCKYCVKVALSLDSYRLLQGPILPPTTPA